MSQALPPAREMIKRLIGTPSVSCIHEHLDMSNRPVIELVAEWAESLGFSIEIQPVDEKKSNLIATIGSGSDGLVLSGHTDTVPYNEELWSSDPFSVEERDGKLYGLGTCDMKSFLALALQAAANMDLKKLSRPLTIVGTADEETTMNGAKLIADNGRRLGAACLIGEPTNMAPIRQHKGVLTLEVKMLGRSGHASNPALGNNAMEGMVEFIGMLLAYRNGLQQTFDNPAFEIPQPTLNLGHIHGGDSSNRICGDCTLLIDIRYLPGMKIEQLYAEISELASEAGLHRNLHTDVRITGQEDAMDTSEASEIAQYLSHLTGKKAASAAFSTEAPFYNSMSTETIVLGPGSIDQAHQPDEYLPVEQIDPTISLIENLIDRFCYR